MTASVPFVAHKFGGSSMRDAERIAQVAAILAAREGEPQVVVVSAMQGVTDALIALANGAAARSELWRDALSQLRERHLTAALALLAPGPNPRSNGWNANSPISPTCSPRRCPAARRRREHD